MVVVVLVGAQGEVGGTVLGFAGAALLALGPRSADESRRVTWQGDLASFAAALALIG